VDAPLHTSPVVAVADWPAARQAAELLTALGARAEVTDVANVALECDAHQVTAPATSPAQDWADSGAMKLTGLPAGEQLHSTGRPATLARGAALALELVTGLSGTAVRFDGARLLGERAALLGTTRHGATSVGGAARLLPCSDGWFALSLPRADDVDLVPALIEAESAGDPWDEIAHWASRRPSAEISDRAALLGLAVGALRYPFDAPPPWQLRRLPGPPATGPRSPAPMVVNFGSLWAAPLCAQLLSRAGARVIDVESPTRPDGARLGAPGFYAELHRGHTLRILDLPTPAGRAELRALVAEADVVITASRHRALVSLGLTPEQLDDSRSRIWVEITGHGPAADRVAFGDDAAVAGGLVAWSPTGPVFAGDAIADPLTGLLAALTVTAALSSGASWHARLTLRDVAAYALRHGSSTPASSTVAGATVRPAVPG
jgi:hypothetical protein